MPTAAPVVARDVAEGNVEEPRSPARVPIPSLLAPSELSCDWLFSIAAQPMLIVDAGNNILRANIAAARLLSMARASLVGRPLTAAFAAASSPGLVAALSAARASGSAHTLAGGAGAPSMQFACGLSLIVANHISYILVHLDSGNPKPALPSATWETIENAPEPFLLTDECLQLEYGNRAFLEMIGIGSLDEVLGQPLARWLGLAPDDLAQMREQLVTRQAVSALFLRLTPEHSAALQVEVMAIAVPHEGADRWGFSIRSRPRPS